jgi:hypothetical protein
MLRVPLLMLFAILTAACQHQPRQISTPADVSGWWNFSVDVGGTTATGEMWLFRRDDGFTGTLTPRGTNTLPVRVLTVTGRDVRMTVDSAEGAVVFEGTLAGDARSMSGTVIYHQGQRFPLTAHKRADAQAPG